MTLYAHIVNAKVAVADLICMFVVDKFLIWSVLMSQILVLNSHILRFNFWIFQTIFDEDMSFTKVVVFDIVETFFIWVHFVAKIFNIRSRNVDIKIYIASYI